MQVNSISNSNYSNTFTGGINSTLYKKIVPDNKYKADIFKKVDDISRTNKSPFVLSDAIYNAKEKVAEFILTAVDTVRFIPGLEKVKPKVVKSSGNNITEAFKNIDLIDLQKANDELAVDYSKTYKETEGLRKEIFEKRQAVEEMLNKKFENAEGFWPDFYRNLEARKK